MAGLPMACVIGGLLMLILAPIAAAMIQMAISRSREFEADASAARLLGTGVPGRMGIRIGWKCAILSRGLVEADTLAHTVIQLPQLPADRLHQLWFD